MSIPFTKTSTELQCFLISTGEVLNVPVNHSRIEEVKQCIADGDETKLKELVDIKSYISKSLLESTEEIAKDIKFLDGVVYHKDKPLDNLITKYIVEFAQDGLPFEPLCRFLSNLMENPSHHSVEHLYTFVRAGNLPITDDGHFLAYKGVTENYKDCHTRTVDNSVGAKPPRMDRKDVDDNVNNACSKGYHAGSLQYASAYGTRRVIVKIHPADVVCVPHDSNEKLRMCCYEVVADFSEELNSPLYNNDSTAYNTGYDTTYTPFPGDQVEFEYEGVTRSAWIDEVDNDIIRMTLDSLDPKYQSFSSNIRNFKLDKMEDVRKV